MASCSTTFARAAAVLSQGGLHADAAILYLKRLGDILAAAKEYEAAGEMDGASGLYRQVGNHKLAGDLLRRAGEQEEALEEFKLAAEQMVTVSQAHYQAGELLLIRAGREDLALPYYEAGWRQRPAGSPIPCAVRSPGHGSCAASIEGGIIHFGGSSRRVLHAIRPRFQRR